jgi:hypothetical protein
MNDEDVGRVDLEELPRGSDRLAGDVHVGLGLEQRELQVVEARLRQLS